MSNQYVNSIYYVYSFIDNKKYEEFEVIDTKTIYDISMRLFKEREPDIILKKVYELSNNIFEDKNIEKIIIINEKSLNIEKEIYVYK